MSYKQYLKSGIKLVVNANGNPLTIAILLGKKHLFKMLDIMIPDEPET